MTIAKLQLIRRLLLQLVAMIEAEILRAIDISCKIKMRRNRYGLALIGRVTVPDRRGHLIA